MISNVQINIVFRVMGHAMHQALSSKTTSNIIPFHALHPRSLSSSNTANPHHLNLLASRSDSSRQRMSSSRTNWQTVSKNRLALITQLRSDSATPLGGTLTWAFDVANDTSRCIVHEFNTHLCHTSTGPCDFQASSVSLTAHAGSRGAMQIAHRFFRALSPP